MIKKEWHDRHKKRLMEIAKLTDTKSEDTLNAGMGEYDYDDIPEDSADTEMSCSSSDG